MDIGANHMKDKNTIIEKTKLLKEAIAESIDCKRHEDSLKEYKSHLEILKKERDMAWEKAIKSENRVDLKLLENNYQSNVALRDAKADVYQKCVKVISEVVKGSSKKNQVPNKKYKPTYMKESSFKANKNSVDLKKLIEQSINALLDESTSAQKSVVMKEFYKLSNDMKTTVQKSQFDEVACKLSIQDSKKEEFDKIVEKKRENKVMENKKVEKNNIDNNSPIERARAFLVEAFAKSPASQSKYNLDDVEANDDKRVRRAQVLDENYNIHSQEDIVTGYSSDTSVKNGDIGLNSILSEGNGDLINGIPREQFYKIAGIKKIN